jgi:hypothetical protein
MFVTINILKDNWWYLLTMKYLITESQFKMIIERGHNGPAYRGPEGYDDSCDCYVDEEMKESEITEKCWPGYTQKGMKTMFGKRYPNCVKKTKK